MILEERILSEKFASLVDFDAPEGFSYQDFKIMELCENNYINAQYIDGSWTLLENQKLPCIDVFAAIVEFKNAINQDDLNILNQSYELVDSVELDYWPSTLYCYEEYVGFEHISISKALASHKY